MRLPTIDEIEHAAYDLWQRRGRAHGLDRADWLAAEQHLTFRLNYHMIVEHALEVPCPVILGDERARQCRFCERTSRHASFGPPRVVVPAVLGNTSLFTAELCEDCHAECRDPLDDELIQYWRFLQEERAFQQGATGACELDVLPLSVYKSLIAVALLIVPGSELHYLLDTIEWVSNVDSGADAGLFAGTCCRVYSVPRARQRAWTGIARRWDHQAALPYLLFFLAWDGIVFQLQVPLCTRDLDLDGRNVQMPEPPFLQTGDPGFAEVRRKDLRLLRIGRGRAAIEVRHEPSTTTPSRSQARSSGWMLAS